jgi:rhomboid protease GluP
MIPYARLVWTHARVTSLLVLACVVVFALEFVDAGSYDALSGSGRGLSPVLAFGVLYRPAVLQGEWWRLVTAGFLHFGAIHILLNLYALVYVGLVLESRFGSLRFLIVYTVALVGGNVAALFLQSPRSISAGASGAIMGLFGAMLVIGLRYQFRRQWLQSAMFPIVATLVYGAANSGISNAAHVGGLISGFVAAWLVGVSPRWLRLLEAQKQAALAAAAATQSLGLGDSTPPASVPPDSAS